MKTVAFIFSLMVSMAQAYDCTNHQPLKPIGSQNVFINVGHFYWKDKGDGTKEEVVEQVCGNEEPLEVPIFDIRGKEEEWFYCHKSEPVLRCATSYQGSVASIEVKPAIVIRSWGQGAALDYHFHAYIVPNNDPSRFFDLFARRIDENLTPTARTLDASGGGRGENSGVDSFYVRADFQDQKN